MSPAGIGHNSGADYGAGYGARKLAWTKARRQLLGTRMPIEIVRQRVKRAAALGLDYNTYASFRAASGRDIVALLFSNNALRMLRAAQMPADRAALLDRVAATRIVLTHAPLSPALLGDLPQIDIAAAAPRFTDSWSQMARTVQAPLRAHKIPADSVLIIGDTSFEATWCPAARAMGYLPSERYFLG